MQQACERGFAHTILFNMYTAEDGEIEVQISVGSKTFSHLRRSGPAFAWRESGKPFTGKGGSSPDRDYNLNLPVLSSQAQQEISALTNYATKAGIKT
uniref:Uncharacterized protein n=1 Tax=Timema tahoe TaxID=61484 RepID=A0A7R9IJ36_9NEOP|nr:unnamed protein product [Timema tahoe]